MGKTCLSQASPTLFQPLTLLSTLFRIVNDILDFAKLQHGKLELAIEEFDLRNCIESALTTAAAMPKAAGLQLGYLMSHDVTIKGDSHRLQQILLNLLCNAIKFTEKGSVTLSCRLLSVEDGVRIQFMVEDSGTGISSQDLDHLMKDFGQVGSSVAQRHCGTGLGLVISQHLLKAMGTKMEIESTPGLGSRFFFSLQCPGELYLPPMEIKGKQALIIHSCHQHFAFAQSLCESLGMQVCHDSFVQWIPACCNS